MSSSPWLFLTAAVIFAVVSLVKSGTVINNQIDWSKTTGGSKKYALGAYAKLNWAMARQYCNNHCMELASIRNTDEQQEVVNLIRKTEGFAKEPKFWIGGRKTDKAAKWTWSGTNEDIDFVHWRDGAPLDTNAYYLNLCITLFDGTKTTYGWSNVNCAEINFFICEHNTTYPHEYV